MAAPSTEWKVFPHAPIQKLTENLWRVEGNIEGMPLLRVMTVAKRTDGVLVVHNAIALEAPAMAEIEAWGDIGYVVVPNGYHRIDAPRFAARYPKAKILCPSGALTKVAKVVSVNGDYGDFPADDTIRFETLDGTKGAEGVMIVRSASGVTLVVTDSVFNMPHASGAAGFVFRHITDSTGGPRVSRVFRMLVIKDRPAFRAHLERLAALPDLERIIVGHHETIDVEPGRVLAEVAAKL